MIEKKIVIIFLLIALLLKNTKAQDINDVDPINFYQKSLWEINIDYLEENDYNENEIERLRDGLKSILQKYKNYVEADAQFLIISDHPNRNRNRNRKKNRNRSRDSDRDRNSDRDRDRGNDKDDKTENKDKDKETNKPESTKDDELDDSNANTKKSRSTGSQQITTPRPNQSSNLSSLTTKARKSTSESSANVQNMKTKRESNNDGIDDIFDNLSADLNKIKGRLIQQNKNKNRSSKAQQKLSLFKKLPSDPGMTQNDLVDILNDQSEIMGHPGKLFRLIPHNVKAKSHYKYFVVHGNISSCYNVKQSDRLLRGHTDMFTEKFENIDSHPIINRIPGIELPKSREIINFDLPIAPPIKVDSDPILPREVMVDIGIEKTKPKLLKDSPTDNFDTNLILNHSQHNRKSHLLKPCFKTPTNDCDEITQFNTHYRAPNYYTQLNTTDDDIKNNFKKPYNSPIDQVPYPEQAKPGIRALQNNDFNSALKIPMAKNEHLDLYFIGENNIVETLALNCKCEVPNTPKTVTVETTEYSIYSMILWC